MSRCTISRHLAGSAKSAPQSVAPGTKLPGGIAVSFVDNHVDMVKLENLWQLYWHKNYQPPATRPPSESLKTFSALTIGTRRMHFRG